MALLEQIQTTPAGADYESPQFEVLGPLTDLAEGQGQDGKLVMQASFGLPGGGGSTVIP